MDACLIFNISVQRVKTKRNHERQERNDDSESCLAPGWSGPLHCGFSVCSSHQNYLSEFLCVAAAACVHARSALSVTACHCVRDAHVGADICLFYSLCFSLSPCLSCFLFGPSGHFWFFSHYRQSLHCHCTLPAKKHNANVTSQINGKVGFSALYSFSPGPGRLEPCCARS